MYFILFVILFLEICNFLINRFQLLVYKAQVSKNEELIKKYNEKLVSEKKFTNFIKEKGSR
jgi:hypothetical protein